MNLLLSEDQTRIVDTLRDFLSAEAPVTRFRPPAPQIGNADQRLWPALGELGYFGIALSEDHGGIGLGAAEEMLVYRELGRYLVTPAALGLTLGAHMAGRSAADMVGDFVSGNARVALANPRGPAIVGPRCRGDFHVLEGQDAEWVLICDPSGAALLRRADFAGLENVRAMDSLLSLERAELRDARPTIWIDSADEPLHLRARVLIAAYALGLAEATRDMAVDYAKAREQFGRPIGSFQAIKHICADMAIQTEAAWCQVIFAALTLAEGLDGADFQSIAAKLVATQAALRNAGQNIQVHGAIGFTAEADAHLYLKRAHVMEQLWGDTRAHREAMLVAAFPG